MVSAIYEQIGRLVVRIVWIRYGREIRIAAGVGLAATALGIYVLAKREPPEG
jgi:hypothetical protein